MQYRIIINNECNGKEFYFTYGNTRNIMMQCAQNKGVITVNTKKDYSVNLENSYLMKLLRESLKKLSLIQLIKYEKPLQIKRARLQVIKKNEQLIEIDITSNIKLFTMISGDFIHPVSSNLKEDSVLQRILSISKSEQGAETAALYAYIYSKTLRLETERFMYTWMAFNGYYNRYPKLKTENEKLLAVIKANKMGSERTSRACREKIGNRTMLLLARECEENLKEKVLDETSELAVAIKKCFLKDDGIPIDITVYGYLITDFAYFLRCTLFHANKPMMLFAFENDMEMKALRIANNLLGEFLDERIVDLFKEVIDGDEE